MSRNVLTVLKMPLQRKVFTKPSRTPAADRYKIVNVKCQVPSPTTVGRRDVKRDLEQKNKRAKEQTPSTRDRHSAKRMREIYVNPNKDKPSHKPKWVLYFLWLGFSLILFGGFSGALPKKFKGYLCYPFVINSCNRDLFCRRKFKMRKQQSRKRFVWILIF